MPRKRKQSDDAKSNGHGKPGHNSAKTLTDDERRALTLHHRGLYAAASEKVAAAKAELKQVGNLAKADLGTGAIADIRDMIAAADPEIAKAGIERGLRLARWMGLPVGTQSFLFDAAVDDRALNDGVTAGMEGKVCDPPRHLAANAHQVWIKGWHDGQAALASAFQKLDRVPDAQAQTPSGEAPQPAA